MFWLYIIIVKNVTKKSIKSIIIAWIKYVLYSLINIIFAFILLYRCHKLFKSSKWYERLRLSTTTALLRRKYFSMYLPTLYNYWFQSSNLVNFENIIGSYCLFHSLALIKLMFRDGTITNHWLKLKYYHWYAQCHVFYTLKYALY